MKVLIEPTHLDAGTCTVTPDADDPTFYQESRLMYHIKKELNRQGYDLIKKRMWKDGHLVDDEQQYIRTRKPTGDPQNDIYIYDPHWQIRNAAKSYREDGKLTLAVVFDVFNKTSSK